MGNVDVLRFGAYLPVAAMVGVAAVLSPGKVLLLGAGLAFALICLYRLSAGVSVFAILVYLEHATSVGGAGIKLAGGVLALTWIIALARPDDHTPLLLFEHPVVAAAALLFVFWALASTLWASDQEAARGGAFRLLQGVLLLFIVYSAVAEPRDFVHVVTGTVGGAVLTVTLGLVDPSPSGFDPFLESQTRLGGAVGDPNTLAAVLLPALGVCVFTVGAVNEPWLRTAAVAGAFFLSFAVLLTGSRGGLVGLAVFLAIILIVARSLRSRIMLVLVGFVTVLIGFSMFGLLPESGERLTRFSERGGGGRIDIWRVALSIWRDHPLLGIGAGNFRGLEAVYASRTLDLPEVRQIVDDRVVVHNTYLETFTELGGVGLLLFAVLVLGSLTVGVRSLRARGNAGRIVKQIGGGLLVGVTGMLAAFFFISGEYEKQLWLMLGLVVSLGTLSAGQNASLSSIPRGSR